MEGDDAVASSETSHVPEKKVRHRKKRFFRQLQQQMEFYFSDANLSKDKYMQQHLSKDQYMDLSIFLNFNRIRVLTSSIKDLSCAISKSTMLTLSPDGTKVCRSTPVQKKENEDECTIYVEELPAHIDHDWLRGTFSAYGSVAFVSIPRFKQSRKVKGFAFVEFDTPEDAKRTLEAFGEAGCCIPTEMAPSDLCSIQTYEDGEMGEEFEGDLDEDAEGDEQDEDMEEDRDITAVESDVQDDLLGTEDGDSQSKKPKYGDSQSKNLEYRDSKSKKLEDTDSQSKKLEDRDNQSKKPKDGDNQSKKPDDKDSQSRKVEDRNSQSKKLAQKRKPPSEEDVNVENKRPKTERETMKEEEKDETEDERTKKQGNKKKKKKHRKRNKKYKELMEVETIGLRIMSKTAWKRLRNKYLNLQKLNMKWLKQQMWDDRGHSHQGNFGRDSWGREQQPAASACEGKTVEDGQTVGMKFEAGVIVRIGFEGPITNITQFKDQVKALTAVSYIDVREGWSEAYVRCQNVQAAQKLANTDIWPTTAVLEGEAESKYWLKIQQDREEKRTKKIRVSTKRGIHKVINKAQKQSSGTHLHFND